MEKNIFIFGDSNVQGFWDEKGGWATRLKQYCDNKMVKAKNFPKHGFYYMVFPLGITDNTTKSILERFEFETEKRMAWPTTKEVFLFAIGKNDIALLDMNESKRNLNEIIKRAKRLSDKIFFLEVAPVDERFTKPVPWDDRFYYENSKIKEFNTLLKKIAQKQGAKVIPLFENWQERDYKKLLADGVHPNTKGHKLIFEIVKDYLERSRII